MPLISIPPINSLGLRGNQWGESWSLDQRHESATIQPHTAHAMGGHFRASADGFPAYSLLWPSVNVTHVNLITGTTFNKLLCEILHKIHDIFFLHNLRKCLPNNALIMLRIR